MAATLVELVRMNLNGAAGDRTPKVDVRNFAFGTVQSIDDTGGGWGTAVVKIVYSNDDEADDDDKVWYDSGISINAAGAKKAIDFRGVNWMAFEIVTAEGGHQEATFRIFADDFPPGNQIARIEFGDSNAIDAIGRLRVSNPVTVFDSKLMYDKEPLLWSEVTLNAGGTATSVHTVADAEVTLQVTGDSDFAARQTFMRFGAQPGKSMLVLMSATIGAAVANVEKRIGPFRGNDSDGNPAVGYHGMYVEQDGSNGLRFGIRKGATDTPIAQATWNLDRLDGSGPSGVTLDVTKLNTYVFDFDWLGCGRVRFGIVIGGQIVYAHEVDNANVNTTVFMGSPNLPLRYEIFNGGNSTASISCVSSTVILEGGVEKSGIVRSETGGASFGTLVVGTTYAMVGIRLKSANEDAVVHIENAMVLTTLAKAYKVFLILNPAVAGTFTYSDEADSHVQTARGAIANTVTGGTYLNGALMHRNHPANKPLDTAIRIGQSLDETEDEIVLCVEALEASTTVYGLMSWREEM